MEIGMKSKEIISAIMAVTMCMSGFSFAQGNGNRQDENQNGKGQRADQKARPNNNARRPTPQQNQGRPQNNMQRDERGAGPDHAFHQGGRLPPQYRSRQYVVDDWRGHHLSAPPRGYHWVQTGGDYVLVAIATGVILQLLLNN